MLIHPVLLYFYYGLIFLFVTLLKNNLILLKKNHNNENKKNTHLNKTNLFIITSILLGCWWAEQELSWGG